MAIRQIPGTDLHYHLVCYDEEGHERVEPDGGLASRTIRSLLSDPARPVTDVLMASHGWKGDVPAAIEQYDRWFATSANATGDLARIQQKTPGFTPLVIGLHWPSLPWGVERLPASADSAATLSVGEAAPRAEVGEILAATVNTKTAQQAIETLLDESRSADSTRLTSTMYDAYMTLFDEIGLRTDGVNARPGFDLEDFDPQTIVDETHDDMHEDPHVEASAGGVLSIVDNVRDALLSPLRQLSFWTMKDRARHFGETAAHGLLNDVLHEAPDARVHLMGHSFGCIVASAMVAGPQDDGLALERAINSLFLVQGALSLWSYANDIPYTIGSNGYFHRILAKGLVHGPIITTRSSHDTAVGRFYPLGARMKAQRLLGETFPEYGGIGAFGIQGLDSGFPVHDMRMTTGGFVIELSEPEICNIDASEVISNGTGASGAHSDIAHPEVAHAFWAGVSCGIDIAQREGPSRPENARPTLKDIERVKASSATKGAGGGLLSVEDEPGEDGDAAFFLPEGVQPSAPTVPSRWINASFEGRDRDAPLLKGEWYQLAFDVDIEAREESIGSSMLAKNAVSSAGGKDVVLTVQIDTDDFEVSGRVSQMRVPREGKGHTKARFDISPKENGEASIKVTILRTGNFIQEMNLKFDVGPSSKPHAHVQSRGRSLSDAQVLEPRDFGLSISPGVNGYDCTIWGPVHAHARMPITPQLLEWSIKSAREALLKVVKQVYKGEFIFQTRIDIPVDPSPTQDPSTIALRTLARAGANLMYRLFEGPDAGLDLQTVGAFLRKLCRPGAPRLKIQILAEQLPIPWGMLYMGDAGEDDPVDWNNFLGMRHILEQIPLQPSLSVWDHGIASDKPALAVSVNFNQDIDKDIAGGYVGRQRAFWNEVDPGAITRLTRADVLTALRNATTTDQILYFYCHAISRGLTAPGGPDASCLVLTDKTRITLEDLRVEAPTRTQLAGNPLVFINACESADLSPTFYDGFVPYFMSKGARGVIGTECLTPAYFATEWAQDFFVRFLGGQRLGEVFLDMRREFMEKHRNPLGLLYAVHCDADTRIVPPRPVAVAGGA